MWEFSGVIEYTCYKCGYNDKVLVEDFHVDSAGVCERGMGDENLWDLGYEFDCPNCDSEISLNFQVSEYPLEVFNFCINNSTGAQTSGEPDFEYLREIYSARDFFELHESISELVSALKSDLSLLEKLTPRQFEEVVGEVFKNKGFTVDITKRTRDGGKDIIAIHTDAVGIKNKYFIECKYYSIKNKISVDVVRALYGLKNTKDGPNKAIIVTTSSFTNDARMFVQNEALSRWDLELVDREQLVKWLSDYKS